MADLEKHPTPTSRMLAVVPPGRKLQLLMFGSNGSTTFTLPAAGEVRIGRAPDCDVRMEAETVSRQHALLNVTSHGIFLVDLGSANGTSIGSQRLRVGESVAVPLSAVITFGSVTAIVQAAPGSTQLRIVRTHEYFVTRVEEECARAAASGQSFAVLSVRAGAGADRVVEELLHHHLRQMDVSASYAPHDYESLIVDIDANRARATAASIQTALVGHGIEAAVGLALFPTDARSPYELIALARRAEPTSERAPGAIVPSVGILERMRPMVERIAASDISVLVLGETGVGKELLSRMVHELSPRKAQPLVSINCAALDEGLLESELFGHERGAFTGAVQAKPGLLESAQGGTVFLDEVGEMPLTTQAKLLRVLETREVTRLGALRPKAIDVRFVAATNRDLEAESARGAFRQDLFFRLNGIALVLPPLRERPAELEQLAVGLLKQACARARRANVPRIAPEALAVMKRYSWPGNVRELRNALERAVVLCPDDVITLAHLPMERLGRPDAATGSVAFVGAASTGMVTAPIELPPPRSGIPTSIPAHPTLVPPEKATAKLARGFDASEAERKKIADALMQAGGNQTLAARLLGVSRGTLITRMEQYGFPRPRKPSDG
jgi:DNA-binding NtrC family response regulator